MADLGCKKKSALGLLPELKHRINPEVRNKLVSNIVEFVHSIAVMPRKKKPGGVFSQRYCA